MSAGFRRADVMSREVADSSDLSRALLSEDGGVRHAALEATARLVGALSAAGARHHDLNRGRTCCCTAWRMRQRRRCSTSIALYQETTSAALNGNLARILRSARKWQQLYGARVSGSELEVFERMARAASAARTTSRYRFRPCGFVIRSTENSFARARELIVRTFAQRGFEQQPCDRVAECCRVLDFCEQAGFTVDDDLDLPASVAATGFPNASASSNTDPMSSSFELRHERRPRPPRENRHRCDIRRYAPCH